MSIDNEIIMPKEMIVSETDEKGIIIYANDDFCNIAGEILEIAKDYIVVGCKQGRLKIRTLQAPSKNSINSVEYIKGKRLTIGDILN